MASFLPGGGRTLLPGHVIVAFYGIVGTTNVLGRTRNPVADADGVQHEADDFSDLGLNVQAAFELVTTVASSDPGPHGTYSAPVPSPLVARYLQVAHAHKLLLILDFQPGRGEFLPQVEHYERFLRDPSVEVALDPEWKFGPGEPPNREVGFSSPASINAVSRYLSGLVRTQNLPQKLLVIHEFRPQELPGRQHIAFRSNLATVLQMDGLGSVAVKLAAYRQVQHDALGFFPGFKIFLHRSQDPVQLTPRQVMALRPTPSYVSFQ